MRYIQVDDGFKRRMREPIEWGLDVNAWKEAGKQPPAQSLEAWVKGQSWNWSEDIKDTRIPPPMQKEQKEKMAILREFGVDDERNFTPQRRKNQGRRRDAEPLTASSTIKPEKASVKKGGTR